MKVYLVGGAVRDQLLGLPVKERDWVVVGSTVEEMLAQNYQLVGKDFPVFLHPETKEEYALARTEKKTGQGYKGFICHASPDVTLEEDLMRRDLTINAIAMDETGQIIDPYCGLDDLKNKQLRHVSAAFEEDPIRLLRIARFRARFHHLGFNIALETYEFLLSMVRKGEMQACVSERIWQECEQSLSEKDPVYFFQTLRECGALAILFPEIDALFGVPNPPKWHPEIDSGWHTLMVLEQATKLSESTIVRFCALTHDLGKACTPKAHWPSHHGHEELGLHPIKQLTHRLKIPKIYERQALLTAKLHTKIHKAQELTPSKIIDLFETMDAFRRPEQFNNILIACIADSHGRPSHENDPCPAIDYLKQCLLLATQVSAKTFVEKGLKGEAIAHAIHQARVEVLKNVK